MDIKSCHKLPLKRHETNTQNTQFRGFRLGAVVTIRATDNSPATKILHQKDLTV